MTGYLTFSAYAFFRHIPHLYTVRVSKGKFVPLVIREGPETQPIGFPAALSPISVRAEIGCPRGTSVKRLYFLKRENGLPQPFTRLRNDKKLVILNAKREKIRNTIKGLS